jgi:hypothetical protein
MRLCFKVVQTKEATVARSDRFDTLKYYDGDERWRQAHDLTRHRKSWRTDGVVEGVQWSEEERRARTCKGRAMDPVPRPRH